MKESAIEKYLQKEIQKLGGRCDKWTSPNLPGVPDRIVLLPGGRVIFVELKTQYGKLQNIQVWYHEQLQKLGVDVRVLKGMDETKAFVAEVQNALRSA